MVALILMAIYPEGLSAEVIKPIQRQVMKLLAVMGLIRLRLNMIALLIVLVTRSKVY